MIYLVSEPSPAKPNGHEINIYFNVNQGIMSCSALCIMCLHFRIELNGSVCAICLLKLYHKQKIGGGDVCFSSSTKGSI